jgi:uncharacterized lipoprotein YddW (UPF0748 family)
LVTGSLLLVLAASGIRAQVSSSFQPPEPKREFRGVWVATVANINWPSKPGLSVTAQKAELLDILETARENHLNAVLLQVRPACDALYASDLEPWTEYLTGTMGQPPAPAYDPLQYAVGAAHRRGLELHAWFNPFRALHHSSQSRVARNHISKTRPDLVHRYGAYLWLNPGEADARRHSLKVILDVVRRYDIDGVHFDDYFYPYPEKDARGGTLVFPDRAAWQKYGKGLSRGDWRRHNVDTFVQQVQQAVHREKPWMQFGISPFGIWRPGHPKPIRGLDAYASLYADARKWLQQGWVDYLVPQLYWPIDSPGQSFPLLLEWWEDQNVKRRHLWPGLNAVKVGEPWTEREILNQVKLTRQFGLDGQVHYNINEFRQNPSFASQLKARYYREVALPPASPWRDSTRPPRPRLNVRRGNSPEASWIGDPGEAIRWWLVQLKSASGWTTQLLPEGTTATDLPANTKAISVRAVDGSGNLSAAAVQAL